jgi:23S rRNA (cytidine1920-2'-O)/16S rRNA (cytidine1409-2'-O)-methyltransferase
MVDGAEAVEVRGDAPRFVGRGGEKLDGAVERFGLGVQGRRILDAGASTGGFTDCLLQHGAREVVALDVGHGQLHERLRADPRVVVIERTNLRHVDPAELGPFDAVVADLSFISLTAVMGTLLACAAPGAWLVLLVKPQFEAGRRAVARGRGVVTDPATWREVLARVIAAAAEAGGAMMGLMASPLRGADGNVEFLLHLRAEPGGPGGWDAGRGSPGPALPVQAAIDTAIDEAVGGIGTGAGQPRGTEEAGEALGRQRPGPGEGR